MNTKTLQNYVEQYKGILMGQDLEKVGQVPGGFLVGDEIFATPSDAGDCRYPYGDDGFNFWTYGSGYMHCNEGLFSPFLRATEGGEPKIAFFAGDEEDRFSCLSVPVLSSEPDDLVRFTVIRPDSTIYISETKSLITGLKAFVNGKNICFELKVINKTDQKKEIFLTSYLNPFLKNALMENSTDRWFRQVSYDQENRQFEIETYEEKDRGIMSTNYGVVKYGLLIDGVKVSDQDENILEMSQTTSRYEYVGGSRSSLHTAKVLNELSLSGNHLSTSFTETGICGDLLRLKCQESLTYLVEVSYTLEEDQIDAYRYKSIDWSAFAAEEGVESPLGSPYAKPLDFKFTEGKDLDDRVMDPFMTHLKKQVAFCSEIKGFIQLSHFSLIGIRDIFQALEAYMVYEPEKAKAKMLEALSFTNPSGQLPRQYSLPVSEGARPAMDLRPFIDQGVWVISTIANYLRLTKDFDFLNEECGYYEFLDEHRHIAEKSTLKNKVIDHMVVMMKYLITNRDHDKTKCVCALYGDWNDALDGLGKSKDPNKEYGTGVSVMATLQVYQNLSEMIEVLSLDQVNLKDKEALIHEYERVRQEIFHGLMEHAIDEDRIVHGWGDKKSYLVGSRKDPDGLARDGLTSNAFWVLSGLHKEDPKFVDHRQMILDGFKRLESKYGLKTFEPYFEKGTEGVGRIPNLPKGTAENGATYIHASMFGVMALFAMGESRKAWDELIRLLPFTHEKVSVSPYVLPNSYGLNEEFGIDGESMQDWQTGSSNVLLKTMIRFVFGFEPQIDGVVIQPPAYQPFKEQTMEIGYMGKRIKITHKTDSAGKMAGEEGAGREFSLNGKPYKGQFDSFMKIESLRISDQELEQLGDTIEILISDY